MTNAFWDEVYEERSEAQRSWSDEALEQVWTLVEGLGIAHVDPVVDIGSGSSRFLEGLLARGFVDLTALDISEVALAEARARLDASGSVTWIVSDVTAWQPERRYVLWRDRATFHFLLSTQSQQQYREVVHRAVTDRGYVLLSTFAPDGPTSCSGLEVRRWSTEEIMAFMGDDFELQSSDRQVHVTPWGSEQPFTTWLWRRVS